MRLNRALQARDQAPSLPATIKTLTATQCREARQLLGWSRDKLCGVAGLPLSAVATFETRSRVPLARTVLALHAALEAAGVVFVPDGEAGETALLPPGDGRPGPG